MSVTWVDKAVVLAIHDEQIAEHGGSSGLRDEGLLDSALARPVNLSLYGNPDVVALAACYGFGIARNHAFIDGNKRVSAVVTELFLNLNGVDLRASDADLVMTWIRLSSGGLDEAGLEQWIRQNSAPGA